MEHQSAVTYGNRFANGYLERDWTGVGVSPKFDFIIIHESAHEWFGNAVSAADVSDMWIHEGWTTYLESLYVEHMFGYDDALKYVNGYKSKVRNREPIITPRGIHRTPSQDMYFKGALFLHTLRSVVDDDSAWWKLLRDMYQRVQVPEHHDRGRRAVLQRADRQEPDADLRPVPAPRRAARRWSSTFDEAEGTVSYRWKADEQEFAMPIRVGQGRRLADDPADDRVEDDEDAAEAGRVRGGDGPVLRQRVTALGGAPGVAPAGERRSRTGCPGKVEFA